MKRFGNVLLQNAAKEATDMLKRLCTNYKQSSAANDLVGV